MNSEETERTSPLMSRNRLFRPIKVFSLFSFSQEFPLPQDRIISFCEIFGNDRPVEVEIGCGKSRFIMDRAGKNPGINFLGVDYAGKWLGIGRGRGEKRGIGNLRFIRAEAFELLRDYFPRGRISVFHIYFPDPWPKKRHRKRRFIHRESLRLLYACLCPGGLVEIATDEKDYFEAIKSENSLSELKWERIRESENERLFEGEKTNYEVKYGTVGRTLRYLELEK